MIPKLFSELGLSAELLKAIDKLGFEQAALIQARAIPLLMQGKDVVGRSQTGSGKTAAFAIPAIEKTDPQVRAVQVLILCPTRELAVQVSEEVHKLALFKRGIIGLPIYGGQSYERQFWGLKQGAQIVIGTPGRVMDHMRRCTLRLDTVKMVVLDEVDVMLNMGFRDDIELILQATPQERQTVFFSATIPRPIQQLIEKYANAPQQVHIEQTAKTVPTVEQVYYEVDRRFKIELLTRLIDLHDLKLGIIFCNTKRMVDDLVDHLNAQGYSADRLHGDMSQAQRDRVMNKFRKSGLEFLVATDVAARGIDVDDVEVVFNYDLPYDGEDYVHRIGRTGRKGRSGHAISFASGREVFQIRNIERYTNTRIHCGRAPTEGEVEEARANVFLDKLRVTLKNGKFKRQDQLLERLLEEGFSSTDIASACLAQLQGSETPPARVSRSAQHGRLERPERSRFPDNPRSHADDRRTPRWERGSPEPRRPRRFERAAAGDRRTPVKPQHPIRAPLSDNPAHPSPMETPQRAEKHNVPLPEVKPPAAVKPEVQKTYSDEEILGSVKRESHRPAESKSSDKSALPWERRAQAMEKPVRSPRKHRPPPGNFTRLHMNLGAQAGMLPIDIVNAIAGETGLPGKVVGNVNIRERHLFVDVAAAHANAIVSKLNRTHIKGHKVKVKAA